MNPGALRSFLVNGSPLERVRSKYPLPTLPSTYKISDVDIFDETLQEKTYQVLYFNKPNFVEQPRNWSLPGNTKVEEQSVFVLGDFRDIAFDSRFAHSVHFQHIKEEASTMKTTISEESRTKMQIEILMKSIEEKKTPSTSQLS